MDLGEVFLDICRMLIGRCADHADNELRRNIVGDSPTRCVNNRVKYAGSS
jgi:hypothetical protein